MSASLAEIQNFDPIMISMKIRNFLSAASAVIAFVLPATLVANPEDLYTLEGKDPPITEFLENGAIVLGERFGKGPVTGAKVVVNHERLEKLTGKLPDLDTKHITGIQHQAGHGRRDGRRFGDFAKWSRWYQEDGNTQIFRFHKGDWNFRQADPKTALPGRIEALSNDMKVEPGTWLEWEGTVTIIKPHRGTMFQMFHKGPQLWSFHLGMSEEGDISFNRRRPAAGKEKKIVLAEKMVGKPLSIKIRSNAEDFEIYKKRPLIDEDWEFVTDGSYKRGNDNKVQFRWGWYPGRTEGEKVKDGLYFVSGTTIRKSTENLRPAAEAKSPDGKP